MISVTCDPRPWAWQMLQVSAGICAGCGRVDVCVLKSELRTELQT